MKKFEFTLNKMLDYKDSILDKEKNVLMQLHAHRHALEEKIVRYEDQFQLANLTLRKKAMEGTTIAQIKLMEFQMNNIRNQLKQLHNEEKVISASIETQRNLVISISQEVSGLDKLKEKQREEYEYSVRKSEELIIAEMISSKFIREQQPLSI